MASDTPNTEGDTPASASARAPRDDKSKKLQIRGPQTFVKIHVGSGETKESFMVQKSFLCHYSPFFNAAFNGRFIEGETQEMTLEDVETDIFDLLVRWVYEQRIWKGPDGKVYAIDLCKLWVLAERCLIPRLQNQVFEKLKLVPEIFSRTLFPPQNIADDPLGELVEYIDQLPAYDSSLKRWSTRVLLMLLKNWERNSAKVPGYKEGIRKAMGNGSAACVVVALMGECGNFKVELPAWDTDDFHVAE